MKTILLLFACVVLPAAVGAQESCTYDSCAMRLEGSRIVVGQHGFEVSRLRPFKTPRLEDRLAVSDSALAHYRVFATNYVPGNIWSIVGGAALGFAVAAADDDGSLGSPVSVAGVTLAAVISALIGSRKTRKAQEALARSIWWYNRDLQR